MALENFVEYCDISGAEHDVFKRFKKARAKLPDPEESDEYAEEIDEATSQRIADIFANKMSSLLDTPECKSLLATCFSNESIAKARTRMEKAKKKDAPRKKEQPKAAEPKPVEEVKVEEPEVKQAEAVESVAAGQADAPAEEEETKQGAAVEDVASGEKEEGPKEKPE